MKSAAIFANGVLNLSPAQCREIRACDLIIAADGGALHCRKLGILPQVVIGDFDSLISEELTNLEADGAQLIRYPSHKDETDLELAFEFARLQGCEQILLVGALGARWDMSIANILLAAHPTYADIQVRLADDRQELLLLRSGKSYILHGKPGDTLSLIPIQGNVEGISTQGLEYPLINENLEFGSPRGVSNDFVTESAIVSLRKGLLICAMIHNGGNT